MIKYGLISETDARTIEKTIDLVCDQFDDRVISLCEIGVYAGGTASGVYDYLESKKRYGFTTGIDNKKDAEPIGFGYNKLIIGDSNEVYNQLQDESQHFIFIDGCHCFAHVISDFFCYASKVKKGGFLLFHDTGKHIKPFKDFQHGDENNPDAYISVRKALVNIGLFQRFVEKVGFIGWLSPRFEGWELIFDEYDENNEAGGICCFKKL